MFPFLSSSLLASDDEDVYEDDQLEFDSGFGNIIVVDNLPVVPREKFEKLEGVIRKIYSQIGVIKEEGLWMPVDPETQKTLGYCFIEYNTPQVFLFFSYMCSWIWCQNFSGTHMLSFVVFCRKLRLLERKQMGISWIELMFLL